MKIVKKVLAAIGILLLVILLGWSVVLFWYYPHYKNNQRKLSFEVPQDKEELRIMSYNIRYLGPFDLGKESWYYRADLIAECLETAAPTVVGFQEVTQWQYNYLVETMVDFDSIITYRDKMVNSEGCPIFYRTDLYTLIDKGSFWLSETPEAMSKDWGAAHYRICSYVILKDNTSGNEFVVFNAHLDHVSDEARINGIQVVLDKIKEFDSRPAILMGDLNAEEYTPTYKSATEAFDDAKYVTENTMTSCTYQSFGEELDSDCIDYIMISPNSFEVNFYKVITDTYDGVYSSDHFPLLISAKLK